MNYVRDVRALIGHRPVNWIGVTALVLNDRGELLLQRRSDTGSWGTLGGLCELGEALEDALHREVWEEAKLELYDVQLLTVISGPETFVKLPNGDEFYQYSAVYIARRWAGTPTADQEEGLELRFFPLFEVTFPLGPVDRRIIDLLKTFA